MKIELYLSLGSNEGDRRKNIEDAIKLLDERLGVTCSRLSDIIETEPWGFDCNDLFLNAAVLYELERKEDLVQQAFDVLETCKDIEYELGRTWKPMYDSDGNRLYHSRPIDIDILLLGELRINSHHLSIPHLLMKERDFVMIPLQQIAGENIRAQHPELF